MRWVTKTIAGVDYDLGHLDGFDMSVTPKVEAARTYIVRVTFGCHTFTRDLTDADTPDLHFRHRTSCAASALNATPIRSICRT